MQVLNVSKNVSLEECERLRIEVRNAAWILESEVENGLLSASEKLKANWGLLNLFKTPENAIIRPNMFFKPRMVEVSELFEDPKAATTPSAKNLVFKNDNVKQQVQNIKAQARKDVQQIRLKATVTAGSNSHTVTASKGKRSR